jgi:molybdate transport system substrate-binding protein
MRIAVAEIVMSRRLALSAALALSLATADSAVAAEIKVLTAGAMKQVVLAVLPAFEQQTGHKVTVDNDTVGALSRRIQGGETFDIAILSPAALSELAGKGKVESGSTTLARVGVGVMVKAGAPRPDIGSVESFKQALLAAKSIGYIDPASGGSSGIYVQGLLDKLGISEQIKPKAKLKQGGYVADLVASGEAELGIHQISEIVPATGVTLVGPLPSEIQNFTTYAAGIAAGTRGPDAAKQLARFLAGAETAAVLKAKGMEPAS